MEEIHVDRTLHVSGFSLPRPLLYAQKMVESLGSGEILKIVTSDCETASDFHTFVRHTRLTLLASNERDGQYQFFIRKP